MQLDESTLAVVASGTHADVAPADGTITIGVWQGTTVPYSADQYGSEIWFGNKVVARNVSPNAPAPGTGNPTTNLHGWIQPASGSADATWVDGDMLTLDTRAQGSSPTTNTMDVGGTAYTSSLPAGATGGFQLLVLDNAGQPTVYPITGDPDETQANEDLLAAKVNEAAKNEVTILVQGFGNVGSIASGPTTRATAARTATPRPTSRRRSRPTRARSPTMAPTASTQTRSRRRSRRSSSSPPSRSPTTPTTSCRAR